MNIKIKARGKLRILLPLIFSVLLAGTALGEERQADPIKQDLLEAGKKVYFKRCVWCHGVEGVGDGPSHDRLFTKPRNFTQGTFKIRWTDSGELPRDEDLIATVTNGLPGSAMPPWGDFLSKDEIESVVQFVKSLVQDREFDDEDETMLDTVTELGPILGDQLDLTTWKFLRKPLMKVRKLWWPTSVLSVMVVKAVATVTPP